MMPLCKNPYMVGSIPCPCNKCIPCLINRKRLWTHRILLESYAHEHNAFITLTYTDENLCFKNPKTDEELLHSTLNPLHLKNFIKRLRRATDPQRLRFYAVGEYGDKSWRPHYHLALFGYEPCWYGSTRKDKHAKGKPCCPPCDLIFNKWKFGGIDNATVENDSAGYIAGYVTKKLTKADDTRLLGRHPEFARQSNRPGIGALCIETLADTLFAKFGKNALTEHSDVPLSLTHGSRSLPLGRYLRGKLRDSVGVNEATTERTKNAYQEEMLSLFQAHLSDPQVPPEKKLSFKKFIQDQDAQKILNIETRHKLNQRKRNL